ncbi:hypothetical protein IE077_004216, partial [Cardiosporidium cionae]
MNRFHPTVPLLAVSGMDESDLYDEFGNYIGPDLVQEDSAEEEEDTSPLFPSSAVINGNQNGIYGREESGEYVQAASSHPGLVEIENAQLHEERLADRAIVPHEEKVYYPDASEIYPEAETLVQEEDTQPITVPIIAPVRTKNFDLLEVDVPETSFSFEFLAGMMNKPELIRNVCLLGHFHHGKTTFVDMLVKETHFRRRAIGFNFQRYTDSRKDEQERGLSIKAVPMSFIFQDSREKSYLLNIFDTPGHVSFSDECTAAMRLCDGAVIIVDALEGVMSNTERLIQHAIQEKLEILLVINSIDRLILELRLPPNDAYHKIRHTIEESGK